MDQQPAEDRAASHFFSDTDDLDKLIQGRVAKARDIVGLLSPLLQGKRVERALSIGSSFCIIEEQIHKHLIPDAEFVCTDMDTRALEHFDQPGLTKLQMSATQLEFPEDHFDFVLAHQVLEHINEYPKILESFSRLCRSGCAVYINVPNPFSPMVGKEPSGEWPTPLLRSVAAHISKKFRRDFMTNTEKYHTGFSASYLRQAMPGFSIHDLRKARLKQEFDGPLMHRIVDLFPASLLFLFVETNIWYLTKR